MQRIKQFYNRIKEKKDIQTMLDENRDLNKVIVLFGPTGVGKSSFVLKLMEENSTKYKSLCVQVSSSRPETIENLHYLNTLYKEVSKLSQNKEIDYIPTPASQGIKNLKRIAQFAFGLIKAKVGVEGDNRLYEPVEDIGVLRKKDYLIEVLSDHSFIVTIENTQNMDIQSFEVIVEIIKKASGINFIFEYTCEADDKIKISSFINELQSANFAEILHYEIKNLDFEEAKKLVPQYDSMVFDDSFLKRKYDEGNGNLIILKMVDPHMKPEENPIQYSLEALDNNEKYVVNVIYLNEGKIHTILLFKLLTQQVPYSLELAQPELTSLLHSLEKRQIINRSENMIAINHDSIIAQLVTQKPNAILFNAYTLLTNHYYEQKLKFPDEARNIERLFALYLKFSDDAIHEILVDLKRIILQYKYPQEVIPKLTYLRDMLMNKPNANFRTVYELSLMMLEISYKMELVKESEENLKTIYIPGNALHEAYRAGILAMDSSNLEGHTQIKDLIRQAHEGSRPRLVMELILLAAMLQVSPLSQSKNYAEQLLEVEQYKQYIEYGYLLRNCAETVELSESIEFYHKSINFFADSGRKDLQAQSYISLSMCHAYKGELGLSTEYLDKAVKTTDKPLKENFLLNNYAVIEMLSGRFSDQVNKNLNDCLLLTSNEYELIIVKCNLLIYYLNTNKSKLAKQLYMEIENCGYEQYQYEELLHIVYQNLMYYHQINNDALGHEMYANKIKGLLSHYKLSVEMKNYVQFMLVGEKSADYFYTGFPFRADFLGYYEFEISRELENYQLAF